MTHHSLSSLIDQHKSDLFALLTSLIRINSENFGHTGRERDVAVFIRDYCENLGLPCRMYSPLEVPGMTEHPDYRPGRDLENRFNVTVSLPGASDVNGLSLMAHLDTEPIGDVKNWHVDPLGGEIIDGKIFGRGATDDKYAVAVCLFLLKLLRENGWQPRENLVVTAYGDEERGGSHGALAGVLLYPAKRVVSMDGHAGELWNSASGGGCMRYRFHTAVPVNGVSLTAKGLPIVMEEIEKFGDNRRREMAANPNCAGTSIPDDALRFMHAMAGCNASDWGSGEVALSFYTDRDKDDVYAELAAVDQRIRDRLAEIGIVGEGFRPSTRHFHYGAADPDCDAIRDMLAAAKEATGRDLKICGSCLSDLSIILKYGSPDAFGFGWGRDFTEEGGAHQPNECIGCDDLVEYAKIMGAYILRTLG